MELGPGEPNGKQGTNKSRPDGSIIMSILCIKHSQALGTSRKIFTAICDNILCAHFEIEPSIINLAMCCVFNGRHIIDITLSYFVFLRTLPSLHLLTSTGTNYLYFVSDSLIRYMSNQPTESKFECAPWLT